MKLLHDNVLIQPDEPELKSKSGLILSANSLKELPPMGRVMAYGDSVTDLQVDDRVVYSVYAGMELQDKTVIVPFDAVMAVLDA